MRVYTAQIGTYYGADALDITIKSAPPEARPFAPDRWDMVLGAKRGRLSQSAYHAYYLDLMRASYRQQREAWAALLARDEVTLLCYCPATVPFCHRRILAREILPALGARYCGER
ncbi:MAG: hypothetical protein HY705_06940 [Gemmatimonadetes bacterium]|nr:hypothetical protein [Gemmatimonadota bacterium]